MRAYMEVGALFETFWTGIPTVVAALAENALEDADIDWRFVRGTIPISNEMIGDMLIERTGQFAHRSFERDIWEQEHFEYSEAAESKILFTNIKPMRGFFRQEALLVYDLSPLLTPQFHEAFTIEHYGNKFRQDVDTSTHFFAISEATRGDLETYFGVARSDCTVLPMGVDISLANLSIAQALARDAFLEPYVLVLGTLEPRKNGRIILDYIARNPDFAERFRIVFVGRDGWLDERERLLAKAELSGVSRERIMFTGFVSEQEKVSLLYNSAFCIYASFFEGYGLPILEAALLGKSIVCSNTSSMIEVSPEQCFFFNPESVSELARAVAAAEKVFLDSKPRISLALTETAERIGQHGWDRCYEGLRRWILS